MESFTGIFNLLKNENFFLFPNLLLLLFNKCFCSTFCIEGKDFGIQAKTSFTINKNWCILVDYIYYFDKQAPVSFWEMNGIAQFIFLKKEKWDYYVLGGLGFFKENVDFFGIKETRTDLQLNLGTGVNYLLTDKLKATIEGRFSLGGAFLVFTTGLSYQF